MFTKKNAGEDTGYFRFILTCLETIASFVSFSINTLKKYSSKFKNLKFQNPIHVTCEIFLFFVFFFWLRHLPFQFCHDVIFESQ